MDFVCYFNDVHEYPDISSIPLLVDDIGDGMLFEYVSNTFLLAYINNVEIIKGYGIHRYEYPSDKDINLIYEPDGSVKLQEWNDDFLFLAKSRSKENSYFYFWFDCDVSDCCIGNFMTDDPIEDIIGNFDDFVGDFDSVAKYTGMKPPAPILLEKINGTIKW